MSVPTSVPLSTLQYGGDILYICITAELQKPVRKTIKVWPSGADPELQDCFGCTDWKMFREYTPQYTSPSINWLCDLLHQQMNKGCYGLQKCHHKSQQKATAQVCALLRVRGCLQVRGQNWSKNSQHFTHNQKSQVRPIQACSKQQRQRYNTPWGPEWVICMVWLGACEENHPTHHWPGHPSAYNRC